MLWANSKLNYHHIIMNGLTLTIVMIMGSLCLSGLVISRPLIGRPMRQLFKVFIWCYNMGFGILGWLSKTNPCEVWVCISLFVTFFVFIHGQNNFFIIFAQLVLWWNSSSRTDSILFFLTVIKILLGFFSTIMSGFGSSVSSILVFI